LDGSDKVGVRSNLQRCFWIGRFRSKGCAGQRRGSPETKLRGGARPEVGKIGHPGWGLSRFWVKEHPRGTRGSPRPRAERGDALGGGCCAGGGGSAGCGRRRTRVQAAKVCYGHGNWRKEIKGSGLNLPKAPGGQSCSARWTSVSSGRRVVAELAERVLEDCAGPADSPGRSAAVL
jgi:hypothetical protein